MCPCACVESCWLLATVAFERNRGRAGSGVWSHGLVCVCLTVLGSMTIPFCCCRRALVAPTHYPAHRDTLFDLMGLQPDVSYLTHRALSASHFLSQLGLLGLSFVCT
jgi:hypothetical protein